MGNSNSLKGVMVPTKEAVTEAQILPILATLQTLTPLLLQSHREIEYPKALDGGALSAVGAAVIKACNRLGDIFDEAARYSFADTQKFFETLQKSQEAQLEFLQAQKLASEEVRRPSFQHRPTLAVHEGGYVAYWGDVTVAGGAIIGMGATPEAALLDFDKAFSRTPAEQVFLIGQVADAPAKQPEDLAETPEEFSKKRRKKK
jgi:hypothetical protein